MPPQPNASLYVGQSRPTQINARVIPDAAVVFVDGDSSHPPMIINVFGIPQKPPHPDLQAIVAAADTEAYADHRAIMTSTPLTAEQITAALDRQDAVEMRVGIAAADNVNRVPVPVAKAEVEKVRADQACWCGDGDCTESDGDGPVAVAVAIIAAEIVAALVCMWLFTMVLRWLA